MTNDAVSSSNEAPAAQSAPGPNVFSRFAGALFSPGETFRDIARRPDILWPLVFIVALGFVSTALIVPRLDLESISAAQMEALRKQRPGVSDADLEDLLKFSTASTKVAMWVAPLLSIAIYAIIAGILLGAFRLMGGEGTYKQAFSASLYAWTPLLLFSVIMLIVVVARGSFDPAAAATIVRSNPAFLVDMKEQPVLFTFLAAIDVFTIWTVALLTIGFAELSKMTRAKAAGIVVSLWIVFVVIRAGIAAVTQGS